jgi:hypothetical protein
MPSEFARQEWLKAFWRSSKAGASRTEFSERVVSSEAWLATFWHSYRKGLDEELSDAVTSPSVAGESAVTGGPDWKIEDSHKVKKPGLDSANPADQLRHRQSGATD